MKKTLAMKILEGHNAEYEAFTYPKTERDAAAIADYFGVSPSEVYKTLVVVRPKGKPILVMLAADRTLNLKELAKATQTKKLAMATHAEAEKLTKLQVGGISALVLLNRGFLILLDTAAKNLPFVFVSSGTKGLNLRVSVKDLVRITKAKMVEVGDLNPTKSQTKLGLEP